LEQVSRRDHCIGEVAASDLVGRCDYADTPADNGVEKPAHAHFSWLPGDRVGIVTRSA
jgi:hypothetical protein